MCINCDEIIQVGNSGTDGWSPILALVESTCDAANVTVHQLVSWQGGTGTRPIYSGNIMTDAWLAAHPIYLGTAGFVTDICEATNLQPANGENGATGATGEAGPAGEAGNDGCNPDISITASVVGGDKTYEVDVIPGGEPPCFPTYELEFPIELFENTVENLITSAFTAEEFAEELTSIGTSSGPQVYLVGASGSGSLDFYVSEGNYASFTQLYKVGKTVTFNFRLGLTANVSSIYGANQILIKFPLDFTDRPSNSSQYAAVSMFRGSTAHMVGYDPQMDKQAIITTNSLDNDYLAIRYEPAGGVSYPILLLGDGQSISISGQITFNIT